MITLITGGARSGKSRFGESLLAENHQRVLYIATAQVWDSEMGERVKKHQAQRPAHWPTLEAYKHFDAILPEWSGMVDAVLLDCITLMVTQLMLEQCTGEWDALSAQQLSKLETVIENEIDRLLVTLRAMDIPVVIITNEVGLGIVPGDKMSRDFRDMAGRMNQRIAASADHVYLVVAGVPVQIKQGGRP